MNGRSNQERERRPFNRIYQYNQLGPNGHRIPFLAPQNQPTSPRDENYWDMLKFTFCPRIRLISFTSFILLTNFTLFVICCLEGINKEASLLEIKETVLLKYGALVPYDLKVNFAYYELFCSIFLSSNFLQYFINQLSIIVLCSSIEDSIGALSTAVVFIGGGLLGGLFGAMVHCCTEKPYVEMSAAIYAFFGSILGFFILNWDALQRLEEMRCFILCILMMMVFLILLITLSSASGTPAYDNMGAVGGMMAGVWLTLAAAPPVIDNGTYEKKCRIFGWTFTGIQTFVCLLMIIKVAEV